MAFPTYWATNYYELFNPVYGTMCYILADPEQSWGALTVTHTYKFHTDNYGMRLDQMLIPGAIGQITGFPPGLVGFISFTWSNRGKVWSFTWQKYPTQQFNIPVTIPLMSYYRIIGSGTSFSISWTGSDCWYKTSTNQYAGLKNQRNGVENQFWCDYGMPGGVWVYSRSDSTDWVFRMSFLINPEPPQPAYPRQYLDGPYGAGSYHMGCVDGLWPGLIREWIED